MSVVKSKVTVIYPKGSLRSGLDRNPNPYRDEDRRMEIEVRADPEARNDRSGLCELIYRMMNAVDGSHIERYLKQYQERSMMVGDLIEMFGKTYKCDAVGWLEM